MIKGTNCGAASIALTMIEESVGLHWECISCGLRCCSLAAEWGSVFTGKGSIFLEVLDE